MTLADFGDRGRELGDARQLSRSGLDPDDRGQLVAEHARVDLGAVAGDHARPLEPLDALRDSRGRQADSSAELRERDTSIGGQFTEDLTVSCV